MIDIERYQALSQIADIRRQMRLTRLFRGYRAITTFFTGMAALAAGVWQAREIPNAAAEPMRFVELWAGVAAACMALVGIEIALRYRSSDSPLQRDLTWTAVEQFLPAIVAGGGITAVVCHFAPNSIWLLPGLWLIFYALAIIASRRLLPGWSLIVGAFYLLCGLVYLGVASHVGAFSPWFMALPFGAGQVAAALGLRQTLERNHGE
ncbi:MAG TPA: hypothetical protein VMD30_00075 [Tepidisphaeraceae bacterium]|nr:hypothetical protein [Tepidisphaeraceae bacterium]